MSLPVCFVYVRSSNGFSSASPNHPSHLLVLSLFKCWWHLKNVTHQCLSSNVYILSPTESCICQEQLDLANHTRPYFYRHLCCKQYCSPIRNEWSGYARQHITGYFKAEIFVEPLVNNVLISFEGFSFCTCLFASNHVHVRMDDKFLVMLVIVLSGYVFFKIKK